MIDSMERSINPFAAVGVIVASILLSGCNLDSLDSLKIQPTSERKQDRAQENANLTAAMKLAVLADDRLPDYQVMNVAEALLNVAEAAKEAMPMFATIQWAANDGVFLAKVLKSRNSLETLK